MDVVERLLISEVLSEYFDGEYYSIDDEVYDVNTITRHTSCSYYTKKHDYVVHDQFFDLRFDLGDNYDNDNARIRNYKFFDLTNDNIKDLINNGIIKYQAKTENRDKVLNDFERENLINYLIDITSEINKIIKVEHAEYHLEENIITYDGRKMVYPNKYDLKFNN